MTNIARLMKKLRNINDSDPDLRSHHIHQSKTISNQNIATLEPGIYKQLSPMLKERFNFCDLWEEAYLNQNWLGLDEINNALRNKSIAESINLRIENYETLPPASKKRENCTIFAHNPYEPDETYLIWTHEQEEPILLQYFGGDFKIFKNIENYLKYIVEERDIDRDDLDDRSDLSHLFSFI